MDMIPSFERTEREQKAHELFQERYMKWVEEADESEVKRVTITLDSSMSEVQAQVEVEAPIEKLNEIGEKLNEYDSRVREQISKQIGRPTLQEAYEEVREE